SCVEQMMRARPNVDEDKAPKMDDRQSVRKDGSIGRLWQEVVHEAEVRRGEEERDGIVTVPPLDQGVLNTGINRLALEGAGWNLKRIDNVQQGHCHRGGDVK